MNYETLEIVFFPWTDTNRLLKLLSQHLCPFLHTHDTGVPHVDSWIDEYRERRVSACISIPGLPGISISLTRKSPVRLTNILKPRHCPRTRQQRYVQHAHEEGYQQFKLVELWALAVPGPSLSGLLSNWRPGNSRLFLTLAFQVAFSQPDPYPNIAETLLFRRGHI
ncbi:hypothetical protein H105_04446 [Trichophyton soudanense CBS 452.61]|uniref:Uncharacterized protein n=1 Tax=Trichophyton soudanense CBS 452.61 TaxID=1215331 RepID=A0A022XU57_TRISD|nr:hypothetical protein H104_04420 [Trichophyton rubrum CBS 289.86]EZF73801.1 hypothetical protein H105_04446 [Trichophyton soudanense CBS 452.61]EZG16598.1 hypothetical protein H107_04551 [Trichophyton rubrum CBS 202.88]